MHKKVLGIFLIICGISFYLLWFLFRNKRKNRVDPLEIEIPFLAEMTKLRVIM
jgi:hypothetical protein